MDRALVVVACVLLLILCTWIGITITEPFLRPAPPLLGVGDAFQGSPELPKERIDAVLADARARVDRDNLMGNHFRLGARIANWLSFLFTAIIALLAGRHGMAVPAGAVPDEPALRRLMAASKRHARTVGTLAAAAAILTAASGRADAEATQYYKAADEMQREALIARKGVLDARDAEEAVGVLDALRAKITRD